MAKPPSQCNPYFVAVPTKRLEPLKPREADTLPATVKREPSKVKLDSTVASSLSLYVATPLAVEPSQEIPPPPEVRSVSLTSFDIQYGFPSDLT
jgi:hypothetical protein